MLFLENKNVLQRKHIWVSDDARIRLVNKIKRTYLLSKMATENVCFRSLVLYEFKKGNSALACSRNICSVFGEDSISARTCQRWYVRFRSGNFKLQDDERSGRPTAISDDILEQYILDNPRATSRMVAEHFEVGQTTILRHLSKLNFVSKLDVWVPHQLTEKNLMDRVAICMQLCSRYETEPFFNRLVTGDEKWILYDNVVRKRHWSKVGEPPLTSAKSPLHPTKVMLCCWWDCNGPLHYEFLNPGETINADLYCQQLDRLHDNIQKKRPALISRRGVILQHDNARPHVAVKTLKKIRELKYELLPHPAYSPDLAPSDYHLFRALDNHLRDKKFNNFQELKNDIDSFFSTMAPSFYASGINTLREKWQSVIDNNGQYIPD